MLSKIPFLILGLIAEKPLNPYQIKQLLEKLDMNAMFPMSSSSVYAAINGLIKKECVSGRKEKVGNMPERTVYSITKQGRELLEKTLAVYLGDTEKIFTEFDIAITLACHLNKELALETLTSHRIQLQNEIVKRKKQYREYQEAGWMPYTGLIRRMHYINKREAELKTINELIGKIEIDKTWNYYPASILFDYAFDKNRSDDSEALRK